MRPQDLITALVRDMAGHLGGLEQARGDVEVGGLICSLLIL